MYHYMTQEVTCSMWQIYFVSFVWMLVGATVAWVFSKVVLQFTLTNGQNHGNQRRRIRTTEVS